MELKVKIEMPSTAQLLAAMGVDERGDVQQMHTENALHRIQRYMPALSGATIKLMLAQTVVEMPEIVIQEPQIGYLYYGVAMEGDPKTATGRPLNYTKTRNSQAGPYFDRALVANEGTAMQGELQRYVDRRNAP